MQISITQPPSDKEQIIKQIHALRNALNRLEQKESKPFFLTVVSDNVPKAWTDANISTLSAIEVLETNIESLKKHLGSRATSKYLTGTDSGFHSIEFKNKNCGRSYVISSSTDLSRQINTIKDATGSILQKDSQEYHSFLQDYKLTLHGSSNTPAVVSPTQHSSAEVGSSFSQVITPLPHINTKYSYEETNRTNCVTPNGGSCSNGAEKDNTETADEVEQAVETLYRSVNSSDEIPSDFQVQQAVDTLNRSISSHDELPSVIQAFVHDVMVRCGNGSDSKSSIRKIKQFTGSDSMIRYADRFFQFVPKGQREREGKDNMKTTIRRADAITDYLDVSTGKNAKQHRAVLDLLVQRAGQKEPVAQRGSDSLQMLRSERNKFMVSKKAYNLFGYIGQDQVGDCNEHDFDGSCIDGDVSSIEVFADLQSIMRKRTDQLRKCFTTSDGYKNVVSEKWRNEISDSTRFTIALRARYLVAAYEIAMIEMPKRKWSECCEKALEEVNTAQGTEHFTSQRSIQRWHLEFRIYGESFDALISKASKTRAPKFFENNPDAKSLISKFALDNLNNLTMERMHDYIHTTLLPEIVSKVQSELRDEMEKDGQDESTIKAKVDLVTKDTILKESHLKVLNEETIRGWMHKLGFQYTERKKCFFVDVHEREDVVKDRHEYVQHCLKQDFRRHCWIQKCVEDLEELYDKGELQREQGFRFERDGKQMIEFHVDDHHSFSEYCNENCDFGGELSVRFPVGEKVLIRLGQDEAIFKQYHVSRKAWTGPKGEVGLSPKDDGAGVMISGITSRELGFGCNWTNQLMNDVNELREGQSYRDAEAAIAVYGITAKRDLKEDPLVRFFEYGAAREGYWNSYHMICQLEDVVDVMRVLFPFDKYDIELALDHSQGHDRLRPNGLCVTNMNLQYGGQQTIMRDSKLTSPDDFGPYARSLEEFYGPHCKYFRKKTQQKYQDFIPADPSVAKKKLEINDTQSMFFQETDEGPFYMTNAEREINRYDQVVSTEAYKEKTVDDLRADLSDYYEANEIGNSASLRKKNKSKLKELAELYGIDTKKRCIKIREGWVGKAKGKLQMLMERGGIDSEKSYNFYSEKGRKDAHDRIIDGTSYDMAITSLRDFKEEKTLLQLRAEEMGVTIIRSPKCHPEIAGVGIEYIWGVAKNYYRREPLSRKRGREHFFALVRECLSTKKDGNLKIQTVRGCAARGRAYMLAYRARSLLELDDSEETVEWLKNNPICFALLDKCVRKFRAHRSANDFDRGFINNLMLQAMAEVSSSSLDLDERE